jgi:hypothetical protein
MGWEDLLATENDSVTAPWTGGREVRAQGRTFLVKGRLPAEHGWHTFSVTGGRTASWKEAAEVCADDLFPKGKLVRGYLIGDRLLPDNVRAAFNPADVAGIAESVHLLEPGLERFARVRAGRWEDGRLIYVGQEFPLGPEDAVTAAFQDRKASVSDIPHVTPALDLAFRFETWNRAEGARLREEAARIAREEQARLEQQARRDNLLRQLGDGQGRREMAVVDFGEAARAALRVGNAELLDWRDSRTANEAVVQFRFQGRRFECVANKQTLRIIDAGVCLINHATNERGDTKFTLESLPGVIGEAIRERKLVVFRHVDDRGGYVREDGEFQRDDDEDDDRW